MDKKEHWENVYNTKQPHEVSWTQEKPEHSIQLILDSGCNKDSKIIDVGGGDSNLVDFLLQMGFNNITVLDISEKAIERAKLRLGELADKVTWVVSNVLDFQPIEAFDLWHDRAAFHFLTKKEQVEQYEQLVAQSVSGQLILGTFSNEGPLKCSGLEITQYSEDSIDSVFNHSFQKMKCFRDDHTTPFNTTQNFLYCTFQKK